MGLKIRCSCCDSTRGQHTSEHLGGLGAGSAVRHAWLLTGGKLLVLEVLIYSVVSLQMDPLSLLCVDIFNFFFFQIC